MPRQLYREFTPRHSRSKLRARPPEAAFIANHGVSSVRLVTSETCLLGLSLPLSRSTSRDTYSHECTKTLPVSVREVTVKFQGRRVFRETPAPDGDSFLLADETREPLAWASNPSNTFLTACSAVLGEGVAGVRGRGWWLAKAVSERGGHRPKKGLLRGGKNRKEEGYTSRAVEKEAGGGGGQRGSGGEVEGQKRDTRRHRRHL